MGRQQLGKKVCSELTTVRGSQILCVCNTQQEGPMYSPYNKSHKEGALYEMLCYSLYVIHHRHTFLHFF